MTFGVIPIYLIPIILCYPWDRLSIVCLRQIELWTIPFPGNPGVDTTCWLGAHDDSDIPEGLIKWYSLALALHAWVSCLARLIQIANGFTPGLRPVYHIHAWNNLWPSGLIGYPSSLHKGYPSEQAHFCEFVFAPLCSAPYSDWLHTIFADGKVSAKGEAYGSGCRVNHCCSHPTAMWWLWEITIQEYLCGFAICDSWRLRAGGEFRAWAYMGWKGLLRKKSVYPGKADWMKKKGGLGWLRGQNFFLYNR